MDTAPSSPGTDTLSPARPVGGDAPRETVPCPLCRASAYTQVRKVRDLMYGTGETFAIVRCDNCRHVYVNPRPAPEDILRYYPDDYAPHHNATAQPAAESQSRPEQPTWYLSPGLRKMPGLRRAYYWLTDTCDVLFPDRPQRTSPPPRVLELGCSDGDYLLKLKGQGWETVGIEPAAAPAERAQRRGLDVRCGVLESGLFSESSFDAVCAWHVIEHLHEPRAAVQEFARILRPNGELLLSLPNYGCWEPRLFGGYWYLNQPPIHLHHFTPKTIRSLLESSGFEIVTLGYQRNLSNVVGSVALWMQQTHRFPRLAERLYRYPDTPSLAGQLALAIPARVLAACRQGGRMTVRARRRAP